VNSQQPAARHSWRNVVGAALAAAGLLLGGCGAAPHPPSSIPAAASTAPTRFRQLWRAAGGWLFTITHGNGFD